MHIILFVTLVVPVLAYERASSKKDLVTAMFHCIHSTLGNVDSSTNLDAVIVFFDATNEFIFDLSALKLEGHSGQLVFKEPNLSHMLACDMKSLQISITPISSGTKLTFTATWPAINVSGTYDFDATIFNHKIGGSGTFTGHATQLVGDFDFEFEHTPLKVSSAKGTFTVESCSLDLNGLIYDGEQKSGDASAYIGNLPTYLKDNPDALNKKLNDVIVPAWNNALANANVNGEDFVNCLKGRNCYPY